MVSPSGGKCGDSTYSKILLRLENDVIPWIGAKPIAEFTAPVLLLMARRMEDAGHTTRRTGFCRIYERKPAEHGAFIDLRGYRWDGKKLGTERVCFTLLKGETAQQMLGSSKQFITVTRAVVGVSRSTKPHANLANHLPA